MREWEKREERKSEREKERKKERRENIEQDRRRGGGVNSGKLSLPGSPTATHLGSEGIPLGPNNSIDSLNCIDSTIYYSQSSST